MTIRDFIAAQVDTDAQLAADTTSGPWHVEDPEHPTEIYNGDDVDVVSGSRWGGEASVFNRDADALHIARHDPARTLAAVAAARGVLDRHTTDDTTSLYPMACIGCPTDMYGDPDTEHIDECPELRDLAWRWHTADGWDPAWCPHYETHPVDISDQSTPRRAHINVCDHCGQQDDTGRHYET